MLVQPRRTWIHEIFTYRGTVLPTIWRRLLLVGGLALVLTVGHIETHSFVLRDITALPFTLTINGANAEMRANVSVDRTRLGLGVQFDPSGGQVAKTVAINVVVRATRTP